MTTPGNIDQPPVMKLIQEARKDLKLSFDRAGQLARMSGTRWRQLEGGRRAVQGVYFAEQAPPDALARMAVAVGVTPEQLREHGYDEAARIAVKEAEEQARYDSEAYAEAERMVARTAGLTERQRRELVARVAADLRRIRSQE